MRLLFGVTVHSSDPEDRAGPSAVKVSYSGPRNTRIGSAHGLPDGCLPRRTGSSTHTNLHHAGAFTPKAGPADENTDGSCSAAARRPADGRRRATPGRRVRRNMRRGRCCASRASAGRRYRPPRTRNRACRAWRRAASVPGRPGPAGSTMNRRVCRRVSQPNSVPVIATRVAREKRSMVGPKREFDAGRIGPVADEPVADFQRQTRRARRPIATPRCRYPCGRDPARGRACRRE